jgi:hypothetical protein|tara:strand:- start:606 stop:824 length:219 start_codon:yes stop_codon:yes gene_type:complete
MNKLSQVFHVIENGESALCYKLKDRLDSSFFNDISSGTKGESNIIGNCVKNLKILGYLKEEKGRWYKVKNYE